MRHTRRIVYLSDNELGILTPDGYEVRNLRRKVVSKPIETLAVSQTDMEKGAYEHFMEKEIHEAPDVLRNAMRGRVLYDEGTVKLSALDASAEKLAHVDRIVFLSQGTSYHAGLAGKYMMEELAGISAVPLQEGLLKMRGLCRFHGDILAPLLMQWYSRREAGV